MQQIIKVEDIKKKEDLIKRYNQICKLNNLSKNTTEDYWRYINQFLGLTHNKILEENVDSFIYHLRESGKSTSTINLAISSINFLFEQVCEKQFKKRPKKFRLDTKIPLIVPREVIMKVINSIKNKKHKLLVEILYSTGVRLDEVINIKKCNIDFNNKLIKIEKGKRKKDRYVIVSENALRLAKEYLDEREYQDNPYLFDSTETKHISPKHPQQVLRRISKKLKLGYNIHPHSLRHSISTHLIEDGYDLHLVQKNLGHVNPNTTQRYIQYANVDLTHIKNPLDRQFESMSKGLLGIQST